MDGSSDLFVLNYQFSTALDPRIIDYQLSIKSMFCPNCGNADQKENTYCRQCGGFLPELNQRKKTLSFGGDTPQEQIRTNLILNFMSGVVSVVSSLLLYVMFWTRGSEFQFVFLIAAFLLAMGGWQFSTFIVNLKLRKTFARKNAALDEAETTFAPNEVGAAATGPLLPEADPSSQVPASVIEQTTRKLHVKREK